MYLGLSIENSVINAAILNDGGDFVWQDSHSLDHDKMSNLLEICNALIANAVKADPNLFQSMAVSAQGGFIGQPSPPDGMKCLAGKRDKSKFISRPRTRCCLGKSHACPVLYESRFGAAKDSAVACTLNLDNHILVA